MKYNIHIFQYIFPKYRDFLWTSLDKKFPNKVFLYSKWYLLIIKLYKEFLLRKKKQIVITDANPKLFLFHFLIRINPQIRTIGFTQFCRSKNYFKKLASLIYLFIFFDKTLFYYAYEREKARDIFFSKNFGFFNNTVENLPKKLVEKNINKLKKSPKRSLLFIGRNTNKSNLDLLFESLEFVENDLKIYLIGVKYEEVKNKLKNISSNIKIIFIGPLNNLVEINEIAINCHYGIYPGDVGLSIIHLAKLGCMPIVHTDHANHYPEYYSYKYINNFPTIDFNRNDPISLANTLNSVFVNGFKHMHEKTYLDILKIYDDKKMSNKFIDTIKNHDN